MRIFKFIHKIFGHEFNSRDVERNFCPISNLFNFKVKEKCECGEEKEFSYVSSCPDMPKAEWEPKEDYFEKYKDMLNR
jgi:hypothetical protein